LLPPSPDDAVVERLEVALRLPRAICRLLAARGYAVPDEAKA
jgi:hypothetical protein